MFYISHFLNFSQELPHLNMLDVMTEGVEKCVDHPMFGGKAKVKRFSINDVTLCKVYFLRVYLKN